MVVSPSSRSTRRKMASGKPLDSREKDTWTPQEILERGRTESIAEKVLEDEDAFDRNRLGAGRRALAI